MGIVDVGAIDVTLAVDMNADTNTTDMNTEAKTVVVAEAINTKVI